MKTKLLIIAILLASTQAVADYYGNDDISEQMRQADREIEETFDRIREQSDRRESLKLQEEQNRILRNIYLQDRYNGVDDTLIRSVPPRP